MEIKERPKKIPKIEKPKILISAHAQNKMSQNTMLGARKPSCRDASAFLTRLKLIWLRSSLKTTKMSKKRLFLQKALGVNGLKSGKLGFTPVFRALGIVLTRPVSIYHGKTWPKAIDLSMRLWGINRVSGVYSPEPRSAVYCG